MDLPSVTMSRTWGLVSGQWQVPRIVARATLGMLFLFSSFPRSFSGMRDSHAVLVF